MAVRTDDTTREIAQFLGRESSSLFAYTHMPAASPVLGCVVICSPLFAEFIRNYRREVLLARRLAIAGIAVARFHYRGHGNSRGEADEATFESMRDDALFIAQHLLESTGSAPIAFLGTRFGGLIAAGAASRFAEAPIALWDPIFSASHYLRDINRAQRLKLLRAPSSGADETGDSLEDLLQRGNANLLGYTLPPLLFRSAAAHDLGSEVGSSPKPVLIVGLGPDSRMDSPIQRLMSTWKKQQWPAEAHAAGHREPWWFTAGEDVQAEKQDQAADITATWLGQALVRKSIDS